MSKQNIKYTKMEYNNETETIDLINLEGEIVDSFHVLDMVEQAMEESVYAKYELE